MFDHVLDELNHVGKFGKSDFRFHVPEFSNVTRRVASFRAETRSKRINLAKRRRAHFAFKLTGNAQPGLLPEEIGVVILFFRGRRGVPRASRHTKHLAGAFTVARGN